MAKRRRTKAADTIENRVYLFESLASAFVAAQAGALTSPEPEVRTRARQALAELAWVSCVVADTGAEEAEEVRRRLQEEAR
jgi:hypothetical protein